MSQVNFAQNPGTQVSPLITDFATAIINRYKIKLATAYAAPERAQLLRDMNAELEILKNTVSILSL